MSLFSFLTCFKRQKEILIYVLFLHVFVISNVSSAKKSASSSDSSSFGTSGSSVTDNHEPIVSSSIDNSDSTGSKNSKYYSSSSGSSSNNGFSPIYYDYQHYPSSSSSSAGYIPRHLQYYSHKSHPYKYYNPAQESRYSQRQLRYSTPDYASDFPIVNSFGNGNYNTISAIEKERDLESAPSSSYGWGHESGHKGKGKHTSHTTHTDYSVSAVNTDGIGLLGLLGLLSLFQFALLALSTIPTTAASGRRKKRTVPDGDETLDENENDDTVEIGITGKIIDNLSQTVLPSLNVVAHARNGKISLNCTHLEVCRTNQLLVKNMEFGGSLAGIKITDGIINMLQCKSPDGTIAKQLKEASLKGRLGEQCEKHYPVCNDLKQRGGVYSLPLLLPLTHPYYYNNADKLRHDKHKKLV